MNTYHTYKELPHIIHLQYIFYQHHTSRQCGLPNITNTTQTYYIIQCCVASGLCLSTFY